MNEPSASRRAPSASSAAEKTLMRREVRRSRQAFAQQPQSADSRIRLCGHVHTLAAEIRPAAVWGYAALPGEPSVDAALEALARAGTPVSLPVTRAGRPLRWGRLDGKVAELTAGTWGIREPEETAEAAEALARISGSAPVLVLVPGLAYDGAGVRLGNGGGFYDRTFGPAGALVDTGAADRLRFAGVCWETERVRALPREAWDLSVSAVVTESGVRHVSRAQGDSADGV